MDDTKLDDLLRALEPFHATSKAQAEEELRRIAETFVDLLDAEKETLRPSRVAEQLEAVANAAAELRRRMERMSDYTREVLAVRFLYHDRDDLGQLRALVERDGMNLPAPRAFGPSMPQEIGWLARLRALERLSRGAAQVGVPSDAGGRRNPILAARGPHPKVDRDPVGER